VLENLAVRFQGHAANWLAQRASERVETMLENLLREATLLWQDQDFPRVSDEEICCTVPFFGCCEEVVATRPERFPVLRVVYDAAQPSAAMLAGVVDPARSPRPDLSVVCGPVTIRIEAKRLGLGGGLPAKYVRQGMKRFLDGRYSSSVGKPGVMLGYVVKDDLETIIKAVNKAIVAEPELTTADRLVNHTIPVSIVRRCESNHTGKGSTDSLDY
jgi:hypothetical protein